jgi:hypothetical protein
LFNWAYQYIAYKRGARLITGHTAPAGALEQGSEPRRLPPPRPAPEVRPDHESAVSVQVGPQAG